MCFVQSEGGVVDHLLCNCPRIWHFFLGMMGCNWVFSNDFLKVLVEWDGVKGKKGIAWNRVLAVILWSV